MVKLFLGKNVCFSHKMSTKAEKRYNAATRTGPLGRKLTNHNANLTNGGCWHFETKWDVVTSKQTLQQRAENLFCVFCTSSCGVAEIVPMPKVQEFKIVLMLRSSRRLTTRRLQIYGNNSASSARFYSRV